MMILCLEWGGYCATPSLRITLCPSFPHISMLIVARLSALAKNVPQRNRGGHRFIHLPSVAEVTESEAAEIANDMYLKVHTFPSAGWFEGMGIDRTEENEKRKPTKPTKTARWALRISGEVLLPSEDTNSDPGASGEVVEETEKDETEEKDEKMTIRNSKADIVKALECHGLVAGKDFDPDAKRTTLLVTLQSL